MGSAGSTPSDSKLRRLCAMKLFLAGCDGQQLQRRLAAADAARDGRIGLGDTQRVVASLGIDVAPELVEALLEGMMANDPQISTLCYGRFCYAPLLARLLHVPAVAAAAVQPPPDSRKERRQEQQDSTPKVPDDPRLVSTAHPSLASASAMELSTTLKAGSSSSSSSSSSDVAGSSISSIRSASDDDTDGENQPAALAAANRRDAATSPLHSPLKQSAVRAFTSAAAAGAGTANIANAGTGAAVGKKPSRPHSDATLVLRAKPEPPPRPRRHRANEHTDGLVLPSRAPLAQMHARHASRQQKTAEKRQRIVEMLEERFLADHSFCPKLHTACSGAGSDADARRRALCRALGAARRVAAEARADATLFVAEAEQALASARRRAVVATSSRSGGSGGGDASIGVDAACLAAGAKEEVEWLGAEAAALQQPNAKELQGMEACDDDTSRKQLPMMPLLFGDGYRRPSQGKNMKAVLQRGMRLVAGKMAVHHALQARGVIGELSPPTDAQIQGASGDGKREQQGGGKSEEVELALAEQNGSYAAESGGPASPVELTPVEAARIALAKEEAEVATRARSNMEAEVAAQKAAEASAAQKDVRRQAALLEQARMREVLAAAHEAADEATEARCTLEACENRARALGLAPHGGGGAIAAVNGEEESFAALRSMAPTGVPTATATAAGVGDTWCADRVPGNAALLRFLLRCHKRACGRDHNGGARAPLLRELREALCEALLPDAGAMRFAPRDGGACARQLRLAGAQSRQAWEETQRPHEQGAPCRPTSPVRARALERQRVRDGEAGWAGAGDREAVMAAIDDLMEATQWVSNQDARGGEVGRASRDRTLARRSRMRGGLSKVAGGETAAGLSREEFERGIARSLRLRDSVVNEDGGSTGGVPRHCAMLLAPRDGALLLSVVALPRPQKLLHRSQEHDGASDNRQVRQIICPVRGLLLADRHSASSVAAPWMVSTATTIGEVSRRLALAAEMDNAPRMFSAPQRDAELDANTELRDKRVERDEEGIATLYMFY